MPSDYENSIPEMERLCAWAAQNDQLLRRNEADTRLHLIDQLLFNCLGWGREECRTEVRFEGRYADYVLGHSRRLIVEAKREDIYFELPAGFTNRVCNISTVVDGNPQIDSANRQALTYCQDRGTPFGAVCNGHQLIAFIGSRADGMPPLEGKCLAFASLEDMRTDFRVLWDNLSKPGIVAHTLHSTLNQGTLAPPPEKLSRRIVGYPGFQRRNAFQTDLRILGELFIEDVLRAPQLEDDFLKACYCPSGALSQFAMISKQILETRYSALFEKEIEGPTLEPIQSKRGLTDNFVTDVLAASLKRRAIILLGDVGVGKTIFIRNLIRVTAREVFEHALALFVDFGKEPALAEDLELFVLRRCSSQLLDDHGIDVEENNFVRGVYHSDLLRFKKGIYGHLSESNPPAYWERETEFLRSKLEDKPAHFRACLTHISKARKRQVVIFLDNVDQRPIDFQERVFLIGQSFAETWPATVFISLRPDTFYQSKSRGALAAYQPRVFTIAPPRIDQVIKLRLEFALTQMESTGKLSTLSSGITVDLEWLNRYVRVLLDSFQRSDDLTEFIDNLSGGNTREALAFVMAFIGSGHVDAEKILEIAEGWGNYNIPIHEFVRAVIYGDFERYDPAASPIVNLFDVSLPDGREHFLLGNILAFIERSGDLTSNDGFVEADKVYDFCQSLGFSPAQVEFALGRARLRKLVETTPRFSEGPATSYRITTAGAYTYKKLPNEFSYIDAMIVDTPIVNPKIQQSIADVHTISDRIKRMDLFRKYLDEQFEPLASKPYAFDWPTCSESVSDTVEHIRTVGRRREESRNVTRSIRERDRET